MSIHFHALTVKEVKKETADCVSISFNIPNDLKKLFQFTQGQNITIKKNIDGEELRRSYSICSSPFDNELRIAVKQVEGGKFSTWANHQLKKDDRLEVLPPTGKFYTELNSSHKKNYLAFAAGSGITPILSIIKTTLQTEPGSQFTLVYGNKNTGSVIFKEPLEALKNKYMQRFVLYHIFSRERTDAAINHGRIDTEKCEAITKKLIDIKAVDEVFICGPKAMIFAVKDYAQNQGIDEKKIHFELFNAPAKSQAANHKPQVVKESGPVAKVTVKLDGRAFDFDLPFNSKPILDAALQQGADLPYACKGGVCCTCRAKLIEGEVDMDVNYALEPEEVAAGYILTCQSHPRTEKVVVDFDMK